MSTLQIGVGVTVTVVTGICFALSKKRNQHPVISKVVPPEHRHLVGKDIHAVHVIELSPIENGIVSITKHQNGAMKVCLKLEYEGKTVTIPQIQKVIQQLQIRHPILRCILQSTGGKTTLLHNLKHATIPVEEIQGGFLSVWSKKEKEIFNDGESLCSIVLTQTSTKTTEVLIFFHHAFCDGKSISSLGNDFNTLLNNPTSNVEPLNFGHPMEIALRKSIQHNYLLGRLTQFVQLLRVFVPFIVGMVPSGVQFPVQENNFTADTISRKCTTYYNCVDLTAEETSKLLHACRRENTTITGALGACIMDVMGQQENDAVVVACGVNMRQFNTPTLPEEDLTFQISGAIPFTRHKVNRTTEELWDVARHYRKTIVDVTQTGKLLCAAEAIANMSYNSPPKLNDFVSSSLTNWGVLPVTKPQDNDKFKLIDVRPAVTMCNTRIPIFMATTFNGKLTLTMHGPIPAYDASKLDEALKKVESRLHQFIM